MRRAVLVLFQAARETEEESHAEAGAATVRCACGALDINVQPFAAEVAKMFENELRRARSIGVLGVAGYIG